MKPLRMALSVLFVVLLVGSSRAQENQQQAQTLSGDQLRAEVTQAMNDLPKELATESQQFKLASTVFLVLAKRIAANVRGYEQTMEFQKEFAKTYGKFVDTLKPGALTYKDKAGDDFVKLSTDAFEKNQEQFRLFYEEVLKTDPQLKDMSIEDVRKTLIQFSAWLYIYDRDAWRIGFRFTYLWPWCQQAPTFKSASPKK